MLMRLGRWLRLVGMDVANPGSADDQELMHNALLENRVLITRDRRLAEECQSSGVVCLLIRSNSLQDQLKEIAQSGVDLDLKPCRCTICNSPIEESTSTAGRQPQELEKRWRCQGCGKLYWRGSHWKRIEETLKKINALLLAI